MAHLQRDFSDTLRRLSRTRGFALAVVVSIGLGIAANTTIFSMVSRFVLRPAPVGDPSSLLSLHTLHDGDKCCNAFPWPVYKDVQDQARSFSGVAAYNELVPASIGGSGEAERVWGQAASANFFDVLQISMTAGRGFLSQEEDRQVVVLSYRLWQRRFGSDPNIAGRAVSLSGRPYTVVGVAPRGFRGIDLILDSEFWVPLGNTESLVANVPDRNLRDMHWLQVVGRLRPGVSRAEAASELGTIAKRLAIAYPPTDKGNGFRFEQAGSLPPRDKSSILLFLGALSIVVLLVLCIACANVANLLLAQTVGRQRETAVRLALGATRMRILQQMIMESIVLPCSGRRLCGCSAFDLGNARVGCISTACAGAARPYPQHGLARDCLHVCTQCSGRVFVWYCASVGCFASCVDQRSQRRGCAGAARTQVDSAQRFDCGADWHVRGFA